MTRYFYRDPLAAAWMAQHFGMQFRCHNPKFEEDNGQDPYVFSASPRFILDYCEHGELSPDSLHLLEPQIGDFVDAGGQGAWVVISDDADGKNHRQSIAFSRAGDRRIIQRDGKAFHFPESEEV